MPETTEIKVSYSVGYKVNMGNYESADTHLSETETVDVAGLTPGEVQIVRDATYEELKDRLDERLSQQVQELRAVASG